MAEDPRAGNPPAVGGRGLSVPTELRELARLHGVQLSYRDARGHTRRASRTALLATLRALGLPVERMQDVPRALHESRHEHRARLLPPVVVAWDGNPPPIPFGSGATRGRLTCAIELEAGGVRTFEAQAPSVRIPGPLPLGYHRLTVTRGSGEASCLLIAAPRRAPAGARTWGVFLPLYAARSERSWGVGDLTDLETLLRWIADLGGHIVATLPLLATFLDTPFDPSPYAPASRLHWNELYADPERAPELERSASARELLGSPSFRRELAELRGTDLVDYRGAYRAKRRALELLADSFFTDPAPERRAAFRRALEDRPDLRAYAAFRAAGERHGAGWQGWPPAERDGELTADPERHPAGRYHLYAQWLADTQLSALATTASARGTGLYFDLPLGAHPASYDAWRYRDSFAPGVAGGAPPDTFFTGGQNWGFAPLHPERIRETGYRYPIACIRHLLRHARTLRIDHVMGLHRLFWVPDGMDARRGVYVRYHPEELYAILTLEAHRRDATLVGEDLGTVPRGVRRHMRTHRVHRTYVLQYEVGADPVQAIGRVPEESFASLNTHDMWPFAAFWEGRDITHRRALGLATDAEAARELAERAPVREALVAFLSRRGCLGPQSRWEQEGSVDAGEAFRGSVRHLAAGDAAALVVGLEDLWGELDPQNVPGTTDEHPNWRRKARHPLEDLSALPEVISTLREIDDLRRGGSPRR